MLSSSFLCCWSAPQQSPPASPISPCSRGPSAATVCTCSSATQIHNEKTDAVMNSATTITTTPSTAAAAAVVAKEQEYCYQHAHHHQQDDKEMALSEKTSLERHSVSSRPHSHVKSNRASSNMGSVHTSPTPAALAHSRSSSPTRQSQQRRQSSHGSISSTSSSRNSYHRGFLSSTKKNSADLSSSPSSSSQSAHHDHDHHQQQQHLQQIQSSPGKSSSKKFSLQKFYYPRNSMTAPSPSSDTSSPMTTNASSPGTAFKSTPGSFSRMDTSASHPLTPLAFEGPRTLGLIPPPTPVSVSTSAPAPSTPPIPSILQPPLLSLTTTTEVATSPAPSAPSTTPSARADHPYNHQSASSLPVGPAMLPSPAFSLPAEPVSIPTKDTPVSTTSVVLPLTPASPPALSLSPSTPPSTLSLHPFSLSTLSTSYSSSSSTSSLSASSSPNTSPSNSPTETSKPLISSPAQSELTPYPASGILPAKLAALIERGAPNKQGVSAGPRPLVLDLRPNPDFDPISIVHSININLPTLLMRRYRRGGAVTSFALESFITMPSDKDLYHLIQDDWRQNQDQCGSEVAHDVVVLDQDMKAGNEEFGRSPSPAWTLVHVLERGGGNCGGPIRLWYLDGGFEAFQAWDQAEKFLIRPGSTTEMNIGSDVEMASITTTTTTTTTGHGHAKDETVHPMSMPLSLPSSSSTSSTTLTDAKTAQAIDKAVSMTNASLGGTPRQRGTPVRRESLFSLNTKSLQRPAGLSRAQTIGVSALNIKPIAIPPLPSTLQPLQEGGHGGTVGSGLSHPLPPLCHKGSWLTVPTSNMTAAAPSPAMSLTSNGMELAHSASPDHSATWSAHSGGSNHGDDHSGGASQLQRIGSKKSFSSTSTLLSLNMSSSANHGIQEEDEEGVVSSGGTAGGASSFQTTTSNYGGAEVRRHHSGSSSIQPPPSATFFNANMGGGGFSQDYGQSPSRMFADGIDSYTNNSSSGFYSNNSNMMAAMMMASQQQHLQQQQQQGYVGQYYNYDDEYSEEGAGDEGEQEISCILPNFLYLGPEIATKDQVQELERLGIKRILNMARECEDLLVANRAGMEYYKIGVQDHIEADVSAGLLQAVDVIAASNDAPIYVHCKAGKSRSVTAIIAYLITQLHWSLNKAYNHVLTQRPCMCPNIGFVTELMRMEERTLGTERAGGLARAGSLNSILSLSTAGSQYRGQDGHGHHHHHHHSLQHHHSLSMAGSPTATAAGAMPMKGGLSTKSSMNSLAILSPPSFRDDVQTQMQRPF